MFLSSLSLLSPSPFLCTVFPSPVYTLQPTLTHPPPSRPNTPTLSLTATTYPAPPASGTTRRPHTATHTDIHFTLIRLVEQGTDIVVTLNVPHIPGETEDENNAGDKEELVAKQKMEREKQMTEAWEGIMTSLQVRDWSLFGAE